MSWYVLQCRTGQEEEILRMCRRKLSESVLEDAFMFRAERLWRGPGGIWKIIVKDMFPGYVFLQSSERERLSKELDICRPVVHVLEESGYLISVYDEEERYLRQLCGNRHVMRLSYGYREDGVDHIVDGPLKGMEDRIIRADWHRRFAKIDIPVARKSAIVWAGLGLAREKRKEAL